MRHYLPCSLNREKNSAPHAVCTRKRIVHRNFDCPTIQKFGNYTKQYILITFCVQIHLAVVDVLSGIKQHNCGKVKTKRINRVILIEKMGICMYKKCNAFLPLPMIFGNELRLCLNVTKLKNGRKKKRKEIWRRNSTAQISLEQVSYSLLGGAASVTVTMNPCFKLQALVYGILPSTTAVFSYVRGSRRLSANEQFFVGAQTVVSLLQTIQIKQGVSFIAATKFTPAQIKPQSFESRRNSFSFSSSSSFYTHGGCVSCLRGCLDARPLPYTVITQTFRRVLTASVDSCAEIKSAPSVA